MKVLMINTVCGITSTGKICTDIADMLTSKGHECKIAYGRGIVPEKYQKYAVRIGSDRDVNIHAALTRITDRTGFYSTSATRKFINWIKEYNPDIIHLHNIHGYYINIKLLFQYLKEAKCKVVWTLHDCWSFTGHCPHYDYIKCERYKTGCYSCPQKKDYPSSMLLDASKKNYRDKKALFTGVDGLTVVTPSEWLKKQVETTFLSGYRTEVINNGIDLNIFKPTESDFRVKNNLQDKKIVLGVANVWSDRKGLSDFIELSKQLDDNYKIVLVGDLRGAKIPENIYHISHTNNQTELAEIYTAADCFVNPTYEDTYPTTNLESLACSTPVITYLTGGSPESIKADCGVAVTQGDVKALALAVKNCCHDRKKCLDEARAFDKNNCFEKYISLYEELLK